MKIVSQWAYREPSSRLKTIESMIERNSSHDREVLKNIPFSEALSLSNLVDYQEGRVVSRTFAQTKTVSLTLFAFDRGRD